MKKPCILVSGRSISQDQELCRALGQIAEVITNVDNRQLHTLLMQQPIDLILIEVFSTEAGEIEIIKALKNQYPAMTILFMNGNHNRNLTIKAFEYGAKDAFRKPYTRELVVERVRVFLGEVKSAVTV